jgi:hypothetical protein
MDRKQNPVVGDGPTQPFPIRTTGWDTSLLQLGHFVVEEDDEVIGRSSISRDAPERSGSEVDLSDQGRRHRVSIYAEGGDFSRIVAELKDQSRIRECAASIEFEGPVEQGKGHELTDFHLVLAVEGGSYG